jgi:hypothetical protein
VIPLIRKRSCLATEALAAWMLRSQAEAAQVESEGRS